MSAEIKNSSVLAEEAPPKLSCATSLSGETYYGRLRPAQEIMVKLLEERACGRDSVTIVDIGLGDGAPTFVRDLVEIVGSSSLKGVTLVGLDNSSRRIEHANYYIQPEFFPSNIERVFTRKADLTFAPEKAGSIQDVLQSCLGDIKVDLLLSSNLLSGLSLDADTTARKLSSVMRPDGNIVFGMGGVNLEDAVSASSLSFKIYKQDGERTCAPIEHEIQAMSYLSVVDYPDRKEEFMKKNYHDISQRLASS